uniref:Uncharacterized protein n=1 Tax=uncultured Desulfobacterium sp. TaxID=201089 RepID=E1YHY9_9BACT|nr:unknown protein [uncultured Desulfobacterium sp.]
MCVGLKKGNSRIGYGKPVPLSFNTHEKPLHVRLLPDSEGFTFGLFEDNGFPEGAQKRASG